MHNTLQIDKPRVSWDTEMNMLPIIQTPRRDDGSRENKKQNGKPEYYTT